MFVADPSPQYHLSYYFTSVLLTWYDVNLMARVTFGSSLPYLQGFQSEIKHFSEHKVDSIAWQTDISAANRKAIFCLNPPGDQWLNAGQHINSFFSPAGSAAPFWAEHKAKKHRDTSYWKHPILSSPPHLLILEGARCPQTTSHVFVSYTLAIAQIANTSKMLSLITSHNTDIYWGGLQALHGLHSSSLFNVIKIYFDVLNCSF